jgi:hypothetical protein
MTPSTMESAMNPHHFDLIPQAELAIDRPDFKASIWKPATHAGEPIEYSECYELVNGRWEGFVSIRKRRNAPRKPNPIDVLARKVVASLPA